MNTYTNSKAVAKLKQAKQQGSPLRLAFLDIDGTWAGTPQEQDIIQQVLGKNGYVITAVTNRASELCADFKTDILAASFGTEMLVRQMSDNYEIDQSYYDRLPPDVKKWQASVQAFLKPLEHEGYTLTFHHLSSSNFRLEVSLEDTATARKLQEKLRPNQQATAFHIAHDQNVLIITPAGTSKKDAVDHIVNRLSQEVSVPPQDLNLFIAGDSTADLPMGLEAGAGTQAIFLIPGGAALAQEENVTRIEKNGTLRSVVIGDKDFPGTVGPATLIAWLRQVHP